MQAFLAKHWKWATKWVNLWEGNDWIEELRNLFIFIFEQLKHFNFYFLFIAVSFSLCSVFCTKNNIKISRGEIAIAVVLRLHLSPF